MIGFVRINMAIVNHPLSVLFDNSSKECLISTDSHYLMLLNQSLNTLRQ